jgi:hypothetical protein
MKAKLMPKMTEKEWQNQVLELAKLLGWKRAHFRTVRVQRKNGSVYYETPVQANGKGFPDLIMVRGNRLIAAELKRDGEKLEPDQEEWARVLRNTPVEVYAWCPSDFELVQQILS